VKYRCLICGSSFNHTHPWYEHLVREHPELEPAWARALRLEGRKPKLWEVLWDVWEAGFVVVERGESHG